MMRSIAPRSSPADGSAHCWHRYGLNTLRAATTHDNIAAQKVLVKNGLVPIGPAELSGKPVTWYERDPSAG
jgi:RimJ/RimL family protein N-acetyltransferase